MQSSRAEPKKAATLAGKARDKVSPKASSRASVFNISTRSTSVPKRQNVVEAEALTMNASGTKLTRASGRASTCSGAPRIGGSRNSDLPRLLREDDDLANLGGAIDVTPTSDPIGKEISVHHLFVRVDRLAQMIGKRIWQLRLLQCVHAWEKLAMSKPNGDDKIPYSDPRHSLSAQERSAQMDERIGKKDAAKEHISRRVMDNATSFECCGDDAEKFDNAFAKTDIEGFVRLMSSEQKIGMFEEPMHPWARNPETVGALAGTQLAILASTSTGETDIKDKIREAGALTQFCEFLRSHRPDRVHAAVVAFSFLTAENMENRRCLYELDVFALLLPHMQSRNAGMRVAVGTTLRNIAMESITYTETLLSMELEGALVTVSPSSENDEHMLSCCNIGGERIALLPATLSNEEVKIHLAQTLNISVELISILTQDGTLWDGHLISPSCAAMQMFVDQLAVTPDPGLNHADAQLEAILNLRDLLEDEHEQPIPKFVQAAARAGVEENLRRLLDNSSDDEVRSSAIEMLEYFDK